MASQYHAFSAHYLLKMIEYGCLNHLFASLCQQGYLQVSTGCFLLHQSEAQQHLRIWVERHHAPDTQAEAEYQDAFWRVLVAMEAGRSPGLWQMHWLARYAARSNHTLPPGQAVAGNAHLPRAVFQGQSALVICQHYPARTSQWPVYG